MAGTSEIPTLPRVQTAIRCISRSKYAIYNDQPVPSLTPATVIIKTSFVALNPHNAKVIDYSPTTGAVGGLDFGGIIVAIGSRVLTSLAVGDRVAGMVHGNDRLRPDRGAFAQYISVGVEFLLKLPEGADIAAAAGLATGVATAGIGLFQRLQVPGGLEKPATTNPRANFVLICGGATASGTRAIQFCKLASLRPIGTASPTNFALVRAFGAEKVFDYHSPTCAADIRAYTKNSLAYALDCVTDAATTQLCLAAIGRAGGKYVALEPYHEKLATRPTVKMDWFIGSTVSRERIALDGVYGRESSGF